ncbi:SH3 domain-containing protein [Sulfitobacter noctilucae]|uniref:SH3 domain-containing protein n=1 Tax=Sulfitobacter noctilucae TaxID=1342302 RepID=UPI000AD9FC55|nr:SH3 domain-containing protein [Sulfitobacter noctilucae]
MLLSFGFLGWAFYEMSGGSDFDAGAIREARLAAIEAEKPQKPAPAPAPVIVADAPKVFVDTDPPQTGDVTRVALNLTELESAVTADAQEQQAVPQNVATVTSSADTPAIIPSLIDPNDGVTSGHSIPTSAAGDIRTVTGNRVNVRGGPGTDFGIVARLVRGDAVKILQDDGNGWVRLEPIDGGPGGWMADFLLESS